ncbi:MAG: ribonuclease HII [Sandaracinobacter sp.]
MKGLGWGIEAEFTGLVFGVDEVGRGPLAGPVVAAAVCLNCDQVPPGLVSLGLADSKAVPEPRRNRIAAALEHVAFGMASVAEIDTLNIRTASLLAMARAVEALSARVGPPAMVLVDGNALPRITPPARAIVKGDATVASIAAAAIAAKVWRDRLMAELAADHPHYGWERNRGYGTAEHLAALGRHGVTPHHRRSFAPVTRLCAPAQSGKTAT